MIQVKEFLNYQEGQDTRINEWLQENDENIDVIDIKYSVSSFQATAQEFSGALVLYKVNNI